jgi:triosephosphate isomerase (TIM)
MRTALVAGNWKMNGTRAFARELIPAVTAAYAAGGVCELAICPPAAYLGIAAELLSDSGVQLGAQNVSAQTDGAFTGETSADMLADCGCHYVIVGHSERRALYGESADDVAAKFVRAQAAGLTPILCVGESQSERESGSTEAVVGAQLQAVLDCAGGDAFAHAVVAYEPVWAIGTGLTATPQQAEDVHAYLRQRLAGNNAQVAAAVKILYGGSVKGANAEELFAQANIDGGLIGGAALNADEFVQIGRAGAAVRQG